MANGNGNGNVLKTDAHECCVQPWFRTRCVNRDKQINAIKPTREQFYCAKTTSNSALFCERTFYCLQCECCFAIPHRLVYDAPRIERSGQIAGASFLHRADAERWWRMNLLLCSREPSARS